MSFEDDRERFKRPRGMGANRVRYKTLNFHAGQAHICRTKGDEKGYTKYMAIAAAARAATLSLSEGTVVGITDRRRVREDE
jgi:hypothetical protein